MVFMSWPGDSRMASVACSSLGAMWLISLKPNWVGVCVVDVSHRLSFMCYDSFALPQLTQLINPGNMCHLGLEQILDDSCRIPTILFEFRPIEFREVPNARSELSGPGSADDVTTLTAIFSDKKRSFWPAPREEHHTKFTHHLIPPKTKHQLATWR